MFTGIIEEVKAEGNQEKLDFVARHLYEITADIIMCLLIMDDASRAPELFKKSAYVYVNFAAAEVAKHVDFIRNADAANLAYYRQAEAEEAENA